MTTKAKAHDPLDITRRTYKQFARLVMCCL
jgi:hypothetical protein